MSKALQENDKKKWQEASKNRHEKIIQEVEGLKKKIEVLNRNLDEKKGEAYACKQQMQVTQIYLKKKTHKMRVSNFDKF